MKVCIGNANFHKSVLCSVEGLRSDALCHNLFDAKRPDHHENLVRCHETHNFFSSKKVKIPQLLEHLILLLENLGVDQG